MTDSDQSTAAAPGPHHPTGEVSANASEASRPSLWTRIRTLLTSRTNSMREDLAEALEGHAAVPGSSGSFTAAERAMLQNVLKLREMRVDDVMVPRADIEAVEAGDTVSDLILQFRSAGHSRMPVYKDNLDNILGFVHIKDAMERTTQIVSMSAKSASPEDSGAGANGATKVVKFQNAALKQKVGTKQLVRKAIYVPPSMPVGDLLQKMQATRVHMAIVVDEYGGTDGLVTIEDLLEAVVGDIEDEHDENDGPLVRVSGENTYIADARVELAELQEAIGPDFDPSAHAEDADTLGGMLFDLVDRVPVRGEVISKFKGFEFEILSADARRIRKVRIMRKKRPTRARPAQKTSEPVQAAK